MNKLLRLWLVWSIIAIPPMIAMNLTFDLSTFGAVFWGLSIGASAMMLTQIWLILCEGRKGE